MAELNIPGVSDKYKTNDLVKNLVELEKAPLKREQSKLETYKLEKDSWQRVNQYMSSVRDCARGLFSYNNPFNEKIAVSSNESVLTAEANRDATAGIYKLQIERIATADKFLSNNIDKNFTVQAGKYTYKVGEKIVSFNWKGGTLSDYIDALNKRGQEILKATIIGVKGDNQILSIESLKTGTANTLFFEDDALTLATGTGMIQLPGSSKQSVLVRSTRDLSSIPQLDSSKVALKSSTLIVPPQNGVAIFVPATLSSSSDSIISLNVSLTSVTDITEISKKYFSEPVLPKNISIEYEGLTINNESSVHDLPVAEQLKLQKIESNSIVYIRHADGTETSAGLLNSNTDNTVINIKVSDYPSISSILIKNFNTGKSISLTDMKSFSEQESRGVVPLNPVSTASDARIKYEGITMTRPDNKIDDIIPHLTLSLEGASEKPVTITIDTSTEDAKNSIIEFVGTYNRLVAELNILTQTKESVVTEIEYFTEDERDAALKRLGLFQGDFTLTDSKQTLQSTVSAPYNIEANKTIKMLSQIGISTKANSGAGINSSQMRGYLEIDEKKLDAALKDNMTEIKNLFGYDSDFDLITDNGVAYIVENKVAAYTQIGGILANKTSGIDTKVKNSESQIKKLETQIADYEKDLKQKYSQMESTLNSLESQSTSISNTFNNKNSGN